MKLKYLAIAVAIMLLLLAVGCGKKEAPAPAPAPVAPAGPTPAETAAAETAAAEAAAAEAAAAEAAEGIVEVPETEMGPGIVTEDAIETGAFEQHSLLGDPTNEDTELARDYSEELTRFSNFDCVKDEETGIRYITVKLTNTNSDRPFMISPKGIAKGYDTYFMMRGMVDEDPGCQVEELAPGESTVCNMIGKDDLRYGNPEGTNRLTIQSPDNNGKMVPEAVVVNCPE